MRLFSLSAAGASYFSTVDEPDETAFEDDEDGAAATADGAAAAGAAAAAAASLAFFLLAKKLRISMFDEQAGGSSTQTRVAQSRGRDSHVFFLSALS